MTRKKIYKKNYPKKTKNPKKYRTRKKLKYKKRNLTTKKRQKGGDGLSDFCYANTQVCISLSHHSDDIKAKFAGFKNFDKVSHTTYEKIGQGTNGFMKNIEYKFEKGEKTLLLSNVLKSIIPGSDGYDNLMYEYLIGTFINKYNKIYPCFVETYGLYQYEGKNTTYCKGCKSKISGDRSCCDEEYSTYTEFETKHPYSMKQGTYKESLNAILRPINTKESLGLQEIDGLLTNYGCVSPHSLALLINYIPPVFFEVEITNTEFKKNELLYVLFQIYIPLSLLGSKFTHYDLNTSNILLHKLKPGDYIEYKYHLNGEIITFKSQYIAKIIDYGRSYFHDDDKINTANIIKLILSNETCVPNTFEDEGDLIEDKKQIKSQLFENKWTAKGKEIYEFLKEEFAENIFNLQETSNISADLYLLIEVVKKTYITYEQHWINQLVNNIMWGDNDNTNEIMKMKQSVIKPAEKQDSGKAEGKINNIHDAAQFFIEEVKKPEHTTNFAEKNKIGTLHIELDKPMKFIEEPKKII